MDYVLLFIAAVFVNNIVLAQFLGICPFVGVSGKVSTALGMSMAVLFVTTISSMVTWIAVKYVLIPLEIEYLQTAVFILIIATLVQFVELFVQKVSPSLFRTLGIYLPLITTNCAVLGVAIMNIRNEYDFIHTVVHAFSTAIGFGLSMVIFAGIRERQALCNIPAPLQGTSLALITAGILALTFTAFKGVM
ncbi:MAG: electron transport complex subunit RsxA [Deltaproteobacteria bacterium]|nr:electron transport complex subunit RsxA [Deltaproteobacteria bacterium]